MDCSSDKGRTLLVWGLISAATLAVFWPVRHHDFIVYDDQAYVVGNLMVRRGLSWAGTVWAFTTFHAGPWHPLTWLSHMLDCQLYGLNAGGHHLTSLLLHSVNAGLLFLALKRLTGVLWRSALVAALFALHPLHVESWAWVAERKDVLSGLFFMLTIGMYGRYATNEEGRRRKAEGGRQKAGSTARLAVPSSMFDVRRSTFGVLSYPPSPIFYFLSLLCFALGLMSKPMLVTVPFVLLLLDYWPLGRMKKAEGRRQKTEDSASQHRSRFLPLLFEKLPFFALSAASCWVTALALRHEGAVETLGRLPLGSRLANALVAYLDYLEKMVWPAKLSLLYLRPLHWPSWRIGLAVVVLVGVSALVLRLSGASSGAAGTARARGRLPDIEETGTSRPRPWLIVGWLWFLGMLVPVSGLMQVGDQYMADRYTYLPSIGLFIMVAWGGWELAGSLGRDASPRRLFARWRGRLGEASLPLAATLVLIALGVTAMRQAAFWQNSETILGHCLAVMPDNHVAYNNLGVAQAQQGRAQEAKVQFEAACRLQPHYADALCNLGVLLTDQGKFEEAAPYLGEAVSVKPELGTIYGKLGLMLDARGNTAQAIACYREGLRLRPGQVDTANNLAWILATARNASLRDGKEAVRLAQQACEATGFKQAQVVGTLAAAYAEAGQFPQAIATAKQAIALAAATGQQGLVERNRQLLELYRVGKAFHEK